MTIEALRFERIETQKGNAAQLRPDFVGNPDLSTRNYLVREIENLSYKNYAALKKLTLLLIREIEEAEKSAPEGFDFSLNKRISLQDEVHRFEANLIRNALIYVKGSQTRAARLLGIRITTLHEKLKRYGIDARELKTLGTERA